MRRFVSGLALLLAFLAGTAALTSYVADQLLLDQSRAGELARTRLAQDDLRQELLTRAVPGYDRLPAASAPRSTPRPDSPATPQGPGGRAGSATTAASPWSRLRVQVVRELRANGSRRSRAGSHASTGSAEVSVPSRLPRPAHRGARP